MKPSHSFLIYYLKVNQQVIIPLFWLLSLVAKVQLLVHCLAISPVLQDFPAASLKRNQSFKDEDIVVKKLILTQDWHQGPGARDFSHGRLLWAWSPATFIRNKRKQNPPIFLASCLIPHHLLIAYTQQLEILVPTLPYCYLDPQKPSKKDVVWITILILPSVGVTQ